MAQLTPYEEYLLLGKLSNTLDEQEARTLDALWRNNPNLAISYELLMQQLPAAKTESGFKEADDPGFWDDLGSRFSNQPAMEESPRVLRMFRKYRAVAAAIIVLAVAMAAYFWLADKQSYQGTDNVVTQSAPAIELKLADGATVNLSTQVGDISVNGTALNNSNNTLTFKTKSDSRPNSINTLTVPAGMDYKVRLDDGTEVWMNSASEMQFPAHFAGATREVTIKGEAYLNVALDKDKPFIVHLPKSTVRVLGTSFNVNTYSTGIEAVSLVEGSVQLQTPVGESRLSPGKEAVYTEGKPVVIQNFDAHKRLSWQKGLFYFDEMMLSDICEVIPRWFGMKVVIDNPVTGNKKFVGVLDRNQPIGVFQDDLRVMAGIDSYIDGKNVLHIK
jgi:Fe2+-dicitrate sensor, membrane component